MIGSTFSPLKARIAFSMFQFAIWLSRNSVVKALPLPSNAVCSGPRPSCGSATTAERGSAPLKTASSLRTSITVTVGESLPLRQRCILSGAMLQPCGLLGTGM